MELHQVPFYFLFFQPPDQSDRKLGGQAGKKNTQYGGQSAGENKEPHY